MANLIKVSEAATLGLHAMAVLSQRHTETSVKQMADILHVSSHHLAKVFQRLEHGGLVRSRRGPAGGFVLKQAPAAISLRAIYECVEGSLASTQCLLGQPICNAQCPLGNLIQNHERELKASLDKTSLKQFSQQWGIRVPNAIPSNP